jgi:hypothetical protein
MRTFAIVSSATAVFGKHNDDYSEALEKNLKAIDHNESDAKIARVPLQKSDPLQGFPTLGDLFESPSGELSPQVTALDAELDTMINEMGKMFDTTYANPQMFDTTYANPQVSDPSNPGAVTFDVTTGVEGNQPYEIDVITYDTGSGFTSWDDLLNSGLQMMNQFQNSLFTSPSGKDQAIGQGQPFGEEDYIISGLDLNGDTTAYKTDKSDPMNTVKSWFSDFPSSGSKHAKKEDSFDDVKVAAAENVTAEDDLTTEGFPVWGILAIVMSAVSVLGLIIGCLIRRRMRNSKEQKFERVAHTVSVPECDWHAMSSRRNSEASIIA